MTMLKFYNSLTKKKELFKPIKKDQVNMYNCGMTVYGYMHIGNARAYIFADVLRRYLEYRGYKVKQIINITDVGHLTQDNIEAGEDKIQVAAKKKKITPIQLARFYEKDFLKQLKILNCKKAFKYPRATEHINEQIKLIQILLKKELAYEVNGSVYFDISSFKKYGKLSGNTIEKLEEGASGRKLENADKRNFYDFALWINDPEHIMNWSSPWSKKGYPGWHIECSAMSMKYLGNTIDIHTGGEDNVFPHHEAEIAQSEGATGKKFVNYWLHVRHLLVDNKKMARREGNFYTPHEIYNKGYTPQQLRFFLASSHYRKPFNFTFEALDASNEALDKLLEFEEKLANVKTDIKSTVNVDASLSSLNFKFVSGMDNDLNVPSALGAVFSYIRKFNKLIDENKISRLDSAKIIKQFNNFNNVLGIVKTKRKAIPKKVKDLLVKREKLRKNKKWKDADKIREYILKKGYEVQDTDSGPIVIKT